MGNKLSTNWALSKILLSAFLITISLFVLNSTYAQSNYKRICTPLPGYPNRNSQCEAWQSYPEYPGVKHIYAYYNETDGTLPQNQPYNWYDIIDRIVYNLNYSDTQQNLQLDKTTCDLLHDHAESGTYRITDSNCTGSNRFKMNTPFGTRYISVDVTYNKSNQTVTWDFGQYKGQKNANGINYGEEKPIISGKNPSVDPNTVTNDAMRRFEYGINMITKDVNANEWQITTTATAYTHTLAFERAANQWKQISTPYSDVTYMGKEITHWQRTTTPPPTTPPVTPPPPPVTPICAQLTVIRPTSPITNPTLTTGIQIETLDQFGKIWNGNYRYSTQSGTGKFTDTGSGSSSSSGSFGSTNIGTYSGSFGTVGGIFTPLSSGANPLNTTSKSTDFSGGKYDDWILIEDISRPAICKALIRIPEAPKPQCLSLNMNPSGTLPVTGLPHIQKVDISTSFSNQGSYQPVYRWTITPSTANSNIITTTGQKVKFYEGTQTSLNVEYNDAQNKATLTVAEVSDQQRCIKTLEFTPPPICTALTLSPSGQKQLTFTDLPFSQILNVNATYSGNISNSQFNWKVNGDSSALIDNISKDITGTQKTRTFSYNGKTPASVTVSELGNPNICKQTFAVIPPEAGVCTGLTLTPDLGTVKTTSYPYKVTLQAAARFSVNNGQKPVFRWEATNSDATVNGKATVEGVDTVEFIATGPSGIRVIEITDPGICQRSLGVENAQNICRNLKATFNGQAPFGTLPIKEFPYDVTINVSEVNSEYPDLPFSEQLIYKTTAGQTNPTQIRSYTYTATAAGTLEVFDESNPIDCRAYINIPQAPPKKICENIKITPDRITVGRKLNFTLDTLPLDFDGTFTYSSPADCATYNGINSASFSTSERRVEIEALKKCTILITTKNKAGEVEDQCNATINMEEDIPILCTDLDVSYFEEEELLTSGNVPVKNFPRNIKIKVDKVSTTIDPEQRYHPQFEYFFTPLSGSPSLYGPSPDREKDFTSNGPGILGVRVTTPQTGDCVSSIEIPQIPQANICQGITLSETTLKVGETKQSVITINPADYPADYIFSSQTADCADIDGEILSSGYTKEKRSTGQTTSFSIKGNKQCSVNIGTIDRNTGTVQPQCSGSINITTEGNPPGDDRCQNLAITPTSFPVGSTQTVNLQPSPAKAYKFVFSANNANCATIKDGAIEKVIGGTQTYTTEVKSSAQVQVTGHSRDCSVTVQTIDVNRNNETPAQCAGQLSFTGGDDGDDGDGDGGDGTPTPSPSSSGDGDGDGDIKKFENKITKSVTPNVVMQADSNNKSKVKYDIIYEITESSYEVYGTNGEDNYSYTILFDDTLGRKVRPNKGGPKGVSIGKIPSARLTESGNFINFGGNFKAYILNKEKIYSEIPACGNAEEEKQCFTGSIENGEIYGKNTLTFHNIKFPDRNNRKIKFTYEGIVNWNDYALCDRSKVSNPPTANEQCPGDRFDNEVRALNDLPDNTIIDDDATVYVLCPYLLTRNGGDVFFEDGSLTGIDVSCIDDRFKNADGLVIAGDKKIKVKLISSGQGNSSTASSCDNGIHKKNLVNYFSSFICEIRIEPEKDWQIRNIELNINENKERVSRFVKEKAADNVLKKFSEKEIMPTKDLTLNSISALNNYFNKPNSYNNVYFFENANLTLFAGSKDNTINVPAISQGDNLKSAARTVIIENGDLIIKSNIKYDSPEISNNRERPTIAFIILNGNIQVDKDISRLDGIYFVSNTNQADSMNKDSKIKTSEKGQLTSINKKTSIKGQLTSINEAPSDLQLIINGAVFGDLDPLAKTRHFVDSPLKDGGAIVIRYDENLLLNPPPGIEEYLQTGWQKQAR